MSKVMIADNEAVTRKRLEKLLSQEGLDVEWAASGRTLMEKLETAMPDLVLLDIGMPALDGMQIIEKLRECGEEIPVVMMADKRAVRTGVPKALDLGAVDYIAKPVNRQELLTRVRRALAGGPARRAAVRIPLAELHDPDTGRIDAKKVAEFLGIPLAPLAEALNANYPTVYKTPAAPGIQKGLRPIKRSIELISRVTRSKTDARAWLNSPHPDLGGRTPMAVILNGRAGAVVTLLENALAGIPG